MKITLNKAFNIGSNTRLFLCSYNSRKGLLIVIGSFGQKCLGIILISSTLAPDRSFLTKMTRCHKKDIPAPYLKEKILDLPFHIFTVFILYN
jgi:hypothetical protein